MFKQNHYQLGTLKKNDMMLGGCKGGVKWTRGGKNMIKTH